MGNSDDLRDILVNVLGSSSVYFQPPSTITMQYPCIVFARSNGITKFADNRPYSLKIRYTVTLIDKDPDSPTIKKLMELPECVYDRHFTASNLNHDVFYINF